MKLRFQSDVFFTTDEAQILICCISQRDPGINPLPDRLRNYRHRSVHRIHQLDTVGGRGLQTSL
jgi:hypothetical protein